MEKFREETAGKNTLRVLKTSDGYSGVVVYDGRRLGPFHDSDPDRLWQTLLAEQGKAHPDYYGYAGARARFLHIFSEGLSGQIYVDWERAYKLDAKDYLNEAIPLAEAHVATPDQCVPVLRAFQKTNLLSQFEKARVSELLRSDKGSDFIKAAAEFAEGETKPGLKTMEQLLRNHGQPSWPAATYLAFLWRPETNMFLKPEATKDFARRVGHSFTDAYASEFKSEVYSSLLDLAEQTESEIAELEPRDRIDTQGFIWVVGNYTEADAADVHAAEKGVGAS